MWWDGWAGVGDVTGWVGDRWKGRIWKKKKHGGIKDEDDKQLITIRKKRKEKKRDKQVTGRWF